MLGMKYIIMVVAGASEGGLSKFVVLLKTSQIHSLFMCYDLPVKRSI